MTWITIWLIKLINSDTDCPGNDLEFVDNITEPGMCCELCMKNKGCAGYSLMGAADIGKPWARRCYLKSALVHCHKFTTHISAAVPTRKPHPAPSPTPAPSPPPALPLPPDIPLSLVLTIRYFEDVDLFLFEQSWPGAYSAGMHCGHSVPVCFVLPAFRIKLQICAFQLLLRCAVLPMFITALVEFYCQTNWSCSIVASTYCHLKVVVASLLRRRDL
eukprot:SAG31_NODE_10750_length_1102_cov_1.211366_1_plen_217_part_00